MKYASTTATVSPDAATFRSAIQRLRCATSRICPAADNGVYPNRSNSARSPAAYGSNGPDTRAQHGFTMTFSSLKYGEGHDSRGRDYADLTRAETIAANGF